MRKTLEKYYSHDVRFRGIYQGPAPRHGQPVAENPVNQMPYNARINGMIRTTPELAETRMKALGREETSLLIEVRGIDGFEDICEDHLIIQGKVNAKKGEEVTLQGSVYRYRKENSNDYGIRIG